MRDYGYGLWALVVLNSLIFIIFALSFFHPKSGRDWRAMGAFSAFVVALFTEMYGFPLTIYLLSGWLGSRFPALNLTHNGGHLWTDLIGWKGDPHLSPFHLASYLFIGVGFWLIAAAWRALFTAQRARRLATTGPYSYIRHPQYAGFLVVMIGLLLQWPTIPTLVMFPILVVVYRRLAISEERAVAKEFGVAWDEYARRTPRQLIPRFERSRARRRDERPLERASTFVQRLSASRPRYDSRPGRSGPLDPWRQVDPRDNQSEVSAGAKAGPNHEGG